MGEATESQRGEPLATFSQPGQEAYRVYRDGTLERERFTPTGSVLCTESIAGASARVQRFGSRKLFRDNRQAFLTIEGPQVAISTRIANYANVAAAAQRFAQQINELAHGLAPLAAVQASVPDQLRELAQLREQGVLTDEEFEAKKAQLLQSM
jgi:hypothetical protein